MPTNSERIEENTLKINTLERDFKNLTEKTCPAAKEEYGKLEERITKEYDKLETKLDSEIKETKQLIAGVKGDTIANDKKITEVMNSVNLIAKEVKELLVLKNKINANMWKISGGLLGSAILYVLASHGPALFQNLLKLLGK